jgi:hypothetical protein
MVIFFGEIERNVGNLVVHDLLSGNFGLRRDFPTPAEPNTGFVIKHRVNGNFKPASASAYISIGDAVSVRDYDELTQ